MTNTQKDRDGCNYLTNLPEKGEKYSLRTLRQMYICELTGKPCIARDEIRPHVILEGINDNEVSVGIHKSRIKLCPARDLPRDLALKILEHNNKKQREPQQS